MADTDSNSDASETEEEEEELHDCHEGYLTDEGYDEEDGDYLHVHGGLYQHDEDEFYVPPVSRR